MTQQRSTAICLHPRQMLKYSRTIYRSRKKQ